MDQINLKKIKPQIKPHRYLELQNQVVKTLIQEYQISNPKILQYLINKFNQKIELHQSTNSFPQVLQFLKYKISFCPLSAADFFLDRKNFNQITRQLFDILELPISKRIFTNLSASIAINYHKEKKLNYKNLSEEFIHYRLVNLEHTKLYDQLIFAAKKEMRTVA